MEAVLLTKQEEKVVEIQFVLWSEVLLLCGWLKMPLKLLTVTSPGLPFRIDCSFKIATGYEGH